MRLPQRMSLPLLLTTVMATFLFASPLSGEERDDAWEKLRTEALNRKRRVIYNTDGCDAVYFPRELEATKENFISRRIGNTRGTRVDSLFYCPLASGFCQVTSRTTAGDQLLVDPPHAPHTRNVTGELLAQGTDPLKITEEYCREQGLEFFASMRMNDTHDVSLAADTLRPDGMHMLFPKFKADHPEYLCGSPDKKPPHGSWSAVDFTHPEVRERLKGVIRELCENYDIDGIEYDFTRSPCYFRSVAWGNTASPEELETMTNFIAELRKMTEEIGRKRGRPILVAFRVSNAIKYLRATGLDVEEWLRRGLGDMIIADNMKKLNSWEDTVAMTRKYGVKCYAAFDNLACDRVSAAAPSRHAALFYGWIGSALMSGVDGLCYFNMENPVWMKELFLADLSEVAGLDKRYMASDARALAYVTNRDLRDGSSYAELPIIVPEQPLAISPRNPCRISFMLSDDFDSPELRESPPEVTAEVTVDAFPEVEFTLDVNGSTLKPVARNGKVVTFSIPATLLHQGKNEFIIRELPRTTVNVEQFRMILHGSSLLRGSLQPPWRRIMKIGDFSVAESIVDNAYRLNDAETEPQCGASLLYPLLNLPGYRLRTRFKMKFEYSDTPEAAIVRAANGSFVEMLCFSPDGITFKYADRFVPFRTDDKFHSYELIMKKKNLVLFADEREIANVPLVMPADSPEAAITDASENVPGMNNRSLIFGSISGAGRGATQWKHIELVKNWSSIEDFLLQIKFPKKQSKEFTAAMNETPEWFFNFAAVDGKPPHDISFNNAYRPGLLTVNPENGALLLNHDSKQPDAGFQNISVRSSEITEKYSGFYVATWRLRVIKNNGGEPAFQIMIAPVGPSGKSDRTLTVKISGDSLLPNFGEPVSLDTREWHDYRILFNPADGEAGLWIDGKLVATDTIGRDAGAPRGRAFFGDGSGQVSGLVELQELKIGAIPLEKIAATK